MTFPALPTREGERPRTGPEVPHLQLSQRSPAEVREALLRWLDAALPGTTWGRSKVSAPSSRARFLDGTLPAPGAVLMPPRGDEEFVHVHADGSLHLALDPADHAAFLSSGWGEKHPLYDHGINVVMLYAPRNETELDTVQQVIAASYRYATGRAPASAPSMPEAARSDATRV
ncbi:luciferase family protein [Streptomyces sp. NPDC058773]|uniref:luciferase domain-containing protein n=1 Tax=Streptomyces sp. NPDC058773 TaxID=3346632 RepID=UPI0036AE62A2